MAESATILCGLILLDSQANNQSSETSKKKNLFAVGVQDSSLPLSDLRKLIRDECTAEDFKTHGLLSDHYVFFTKHGFAVTENAERRFKVDDALRPQNEIAICKKSDRIRIRVLDKNSDLIAHIYIRLTTTLDMFRLVMESKLRESEPKKVFNFDFVDNKGETIARSDEGTKIIYDIFEKKRKTVIIDIKESTAKKHSKCFNYKSKVKKSKGTCEVESPLVSHKILSNNDGHAELMISYTTRDATTHALQLYNELTSLGIKVYLDKHNIKSGDIWEQSLNDAVVNCKVFVPIVTPNYGRTTWTLRELSAAVVKDDKLILPINLIDNWVPSHIHLLLSGIQYIPGVVENDEPKLGFERNWKAEDVKRVANVINERMMQMGDVPIECDSIKDNVAIIAHPISQSVYEIIDSQLKKLELPSNVVWTQNKVEVISELKGLIRKQCEKITVQHEKTDEIVTENDHVNENEEKDVVDINKENLINKSPESKQKKNVAVISDPFSSQSHKSRKVIDASKIVILLACKESFESKHFQEIAYYASIKTNTIIVLCDDIETPLWFTQLFFDQRYLDIKNANFEDLLSEAVKIEMSTNLDQRCIARDDLKADLTEPLICATSECECRVSVLAPLDANNKAYKAANLQILSKLTGFDNVALLTDSVDASSAIFQDANIFHVQLCNENDSWTKCGPVITVGNNETEKNEAIAAATDVCVLFIDSEKICGKLHTYLWNETPVIPLLLDHSIDSPDLNDTLDLLKCWYSIEKSDLVLTESNITNVVDKVYDVILQILKSRELEPGKHKISDSNSSKDKSCIIQ